jgi:hypothetical protein
MAALRLLIGSVFLLGSATVYAQYSPPVPERSQAPDIFNRHADKDPFEPSAQQRVRLQQARKIDRKKHMVDDAARLVQLCGQLRGDVAAGNPWPADDKRLDEIARLARSVKERMKQ